MKKLGCLSLLVFVLFLVACSSIQPLTTDSAPSLPGTSLPTANVVPSATFVEESNPLLQIPGSILDELRNSEYRLGLLDQVRFVELKDGRYQEGAPGGADYFSVSLTDFIAWGDLNGDGVNETIAIFAENYGGSGTFVFLAVYQSQGQEFQFLTSIFLDDRPLVNEMSVEDGEIFVDAVVHDRDDAMCCPTLSTKRHYFLNGANLILSDYSTVTPTGQPRVITIEAPVGGADVSGIMRLRGSVTIAPFENNLVYRIYDLGGVELTVGPVTVNAPDLGAPGTFEKAIDLGNILKNTSIRIAVQDINAEDGSLFAMDSIVLRVR